jgi:hypothetical protein
LKKLVARSDIVLDDVVPGALARGLDSIDDPPVDPASPRVRSADS